MKKILCLIIIIVLILSAAVVFLDYRGVGGSPVTVVIPQGTGATEIVKILAENRVIGLSFLFRQYIKEDAEHLRAGVHTFTRFMGYEKALTELKRDVPLENSVSVTIPEGYEAREIGMLLESQGITSAAAFDEACRAAYTRYSFLPEDGTIEGYLFPATYDFQLDCDAASVVDKMVETFSEKMLTPENRARADALGMSFHEVLTLASIVEREAALDSERTIVASVFHNRLEKGMRLESCATVQYILQERKDILLISDTKIESPYNTYLHTGLPPTPIASPGTESLAAALYPADTKYLFFVTDGTGGHAFSETYAEHMAAAEAQAEKGMAEGILAASAA